jgi:hypothetical protein
MIVVHSHGVEGILVVVVKPRQLFSSLVCGYEAVRNNDVSRVDHLVRTASTGRRPGSEKVTGNISFPQCLRCISLRKFLTYVHAVILPSNCSLRSPVIGFLRLGSSIFMEC